MVYLKKKLYDFEVVKKVLDIDWAFCWQNCSYYSVPLLGIAHLCNGLKW